MRTGRQIAGLPRSKRVNLKLARKRKKYKRQKRKELSRDEMIDLLRAHDARTAERWRAVRSPDDPNVYDYQKEFGSWADAVLIAFPEMPSKKKSPPRGNKPSRRKKRPSRKGKRYRGRVLLDREGLVEYARSNNIRSSHQLTKKRKKKDPNVYDYQKEFGSWKKAMQYIWGKDVTTDFTPIYMLQCICLYEIRTAKAYRAARRKYPFTVPSMHAIIVEYGSWRNAKESASRLACKPVQKQFEDYWDELGRPPTIKECKKKGIKIEVLIDFHGGVKKFESITRMMERVRERQKRSSAKVPRGKS